MALLDRKQPLLLLCLLSASLLVADENKSDEAQQMSEPEAEKVVELKSEEPIIENDRSKEPVQSPTQASPNTELKPLELRERIRAHANIDLPQDI
ncbi:MAG: hypothetical protein J4G19_01415 [Pseudomonadales bacterium]|nr:hypothetical protein [Pseudomonadales bacterium]